MTASSALSYPSLGDSPTIFVNIINPHANRPQMFQMLVDTGASKTCLPASRADFFGHNNSDGRVKVTEVKGVGGTSKAFIHTLQLELIDPAGRIWRKLIPPWRSQVMPVLFVEKMETQAGIIGRDVLALWKRIGFTPIKSRDSSWLIDISL